MNRRGARPASEGAAPRITAGLLRGRTVQVPQTGGVRPMLSRTRQALFNMLGNDVSGSVWDCFAGSGLLGLEALSRGADHAVFIERDKRHAQIVQQNITGLGVLDQCSVIGGSAFAVIRPGGKHEHVPAALVFLDPPHAMAIDAGSDFWPWLRALPDTALVNFETTLVFGHPGGMPLPDLGALRVADQRQYGSVAFSLLRL